MADSSWGTDDAQEAAQARAALSIVRAATALLVVGILGAVTSALSFAVSVASLVEEVVGDDDPEDTVLSVFIRVALAGISLVTSAIVVYGALQMRSARSYAWAMTAAVLAAIPCMGLFCCFIPMPIGIWALIVLLNDDVKRAFG